LQEAGENGVAMMLKYNRGSIFGGTDYTCIIPHVKKKTSIQQSNILI